LEAAAKLAPDDPAVFDHLAETYLASGQKDEAVTTWHKTLELLTKQKENSNTGATRQQAEISRLRIESTLDRLNKEKK